VPGKTEWLGFVRDSGTMLTALEFECDASDNITFAPGVCEAETSALEQCLQ
jgi:hypothetical protein